MATQDDIYATLTRIFREVFHNDGIVLQASSTPATIAGWDSFKYVSVLMAVEAAYDMELDGPELDALESVGELVALIQAKAGR